MDNNLGNDDLPQGWIVAKISQVCDILDSKRIPVNSTERTSRIFGKPYSMLFPYYGATGEVGKIDDYLFEGEHLLLGEDGAPFLEPFKNKAYLAIGKFWVNNHAHILQAGASNKFICHYLNQFNFANYVTGTTRLKLNQAVLREIPVLLPPLHEQHRIVAKIEALFSELDKGIECFKTAREQLKIYRQALLKHAFSGKLTAQWRAENQDKLETAEALLQRIQTEREQRYQQQLEDWENKSSSIPLLQRGKPNRATIQTTTQPIIPPFEKGGLGGISKPKAPKTLPPLTTEELAELPELPEGWAWVKSGELFESVTSGSRGWAKYYADSGAIFIRITNLDFDSLKLDLNPKKIQYVQPPVGAEGLRTKVKEGDFLFSITGYLGMFAIAPSLDDAYVNQHISLARPLDGFSKKYFGYYVTLHTGGIHHLNKQTKGAVKAGLGLDDIQNFPIPMCSLNEQIKISCELESRLSEVDQLDQTLTTALQQAEALRQSILKKAFSRQLVPQDPNDEPASVLLERIQAEKATLATPIKKRSKYA